jgi:hypothetical protein
MHDACDWARVGHASGTRRACAGHARWRKAARVRASGTLAAAHLPVTGGGGWLSMK